MISLNILTSNDFNMVMRVDDVHVNFIIKCLKLFVKIQHTDLFDTAPFEKIV